MLKVYGAANTRSLRVVWALEELGLDYQYQAIDLAAGMAQHEDFLAINPAGKLPALEDDGVVLTESAAIVNYLADKYSDNQFSPKAGTAARGKYDQWCYFVMTELEQPLWTIGKHKFAIPKEHRVSGVLNTAAWEFQRAANLLSMGLGEQDYILGDEFSMADILVFQTLIWALAFKQPVEQSNLQAYIERVQQRPALAVAIAKEKQV